MRKLIQSLHSISNEPLLQSIATATDLVRDFRRHKVPLWILLGMGFNLVLAPAVYASTGEQLSRSQAWALGLLALVSLAIAVYLFFVMFQPERF
jgi:K+-transporting ATPase KdpF subunit